jgi:hypothetical protein
LGAPPWSGITLVGAFWNCADRAETLLTAMRPWFKRIAIAVQESDDDTLERVRAIADVAIPDKWHGHGNASFQKAISAAKTPWCFLISDDEMPDELLLLGMQEMVDRAEAEKLDGWWYHFHSTIDGFEFTREQDNHLRLFRTRWGWPNTIHSRPMIPMNRTGFWPHGRGCISHDRTLDEMMRDYLRRYRIGQGNKNWDAHNKRMMLAACRAIAERRGADYVTAFPWWKDVRSLTGLDLEGGDHGGA